MANTINYKGKEITVRGGAWADDMNSCFYEVIDSVSVKGYIVCREYDNNEIFALRGTLAVDVLKEV